MLLETVLFLQDFFPNITRDIAEMLIVVFLFFTENEKLWVSGFLQQEL